MFKKKENIFCFCGKKGLYVFLPLYKLKLNLWQILMQLRSHNTKRTYSQREYESDSESDSNNYELSSAQFSVTEK